MQKSLQILFTVIFLGTFFLFGFYFGAFYTKKDTDKSGRKQKSKPTGKQQTISLNKPSNIPDKNQHHLDSASNKNQNQNEKPEVRPADSDPSSPQKKTRKTAQPRGTSLENRNSIEFSLEPAKKHTNDDGSFLGGNFVEPQIGTGVRDPLLQISLHSRPGLLGSNRMDPGNVHLELKNLIQYLLRSDQIHHRIYGLKFLAKLYQDDYLEKGPTARKREFIKNYINTLNSESHVRVRRAGYFYLLSELYLDDWFMAFDLIVPSLYNIKSIKTQKIVLNVIGRNMYQTSGWVKDPEFSKQIVLDYLNAVVPIKRKENMNLSFFLNRTVRCNNLFRNYLLHLRSGYSNDLIVKNLTVYITLIKRANEYLSRVTSWKILRKPESNY